MKAYLRKFFLSFFSIIFLFIAGCQSFPQPAVSEPEEKPEMIIQNPYTLQEGESELKKGQVYLDSAIWDAVAGTLMLSGNLPNPCSQLRIDTIQTGTELAVEVFSIQSSEGICAQMLEPFEAVLVLENFPEEDFSISINGEKVGM